MKCLLFLLFLGLVASYACASQPDKKDSLPNDNNIHSEQLALIPYPQHVERKNGVLTLNSTIRVEAPDIANTALLALQGLLKTVNVAQDANAVTRLKLQLVDEPSLGNEGYRLDIEQDIILSANTDMGLFYAVQTLSQIFPKQSPTTYYLPKVNIIDIPAFSWRGNMLDVARSFLPVEYIKAHIDRMARFKMNRLHLHLTDDQGWRIEIKGYPKLTEIGGASAVKGGRSGFYTRQQIKELVQYSQDRHVTLVPEVDLPGHTQAAIASYNQLACDDVTNLAPYNGLKVGFSKLCLTKPDTTYPFVTDVLRQIVALFPSPYIHIGGDEIKDPLYPDFIAQATAIVEGLGRRAVAWEEASAADNNPHLLLQRWNDKYDIQPAVDRGHQIIISPCSYSYFDHGNYQGQPNTYDWCRKEGVPLERAYQLNPHHYKQAIGVESAMWSELVHTNAAADNRLWPRLLVTAELGWTTKQQLNYPGFIQRVKALRFMLDELNIQYYQGPELEGKYLAH